MSFWPRVRVRQSLCRHPARSRQTGKLYQIPVIVLSDVLARYNGQWINRDRNIFQAPAAPQAFFRYACRRHRKSLPRRPCEACSISPMRATPGIVPFPLSRFMLINCGYILQDFPQTACFAQKNGPGRTEGEQGAPLPTGILPCFPEAHSAARDPKVPVAPPA